MTLFPVSAVISIVAILTKRADRLPYLLALQAVLISACEIYSYDHDLLSPEAIAYFGASIANSILPPLLLLKLAKHVDNPPEEAPRIAVAFSSGVAALLVYLSLLPPFKAKEVMSCALSTITPIFMIAYSLNPVRVITALNMASNALHPLLAEGPPFFSAISNLSMLLVNGVAFFLIDQARKTYGGSDLAGWDKWLKK